jgi:hypothetical protein
VIITIEPSDSYLTIMASPFRGEARARHQREVLMPIILRDPGLEGEPGLVAVGHECPQGTLKPAASKTRLRIPLAHLLRLSA